MWLPFTGENKDQTKKMLLIKDAHMAFAASATIKKSDSDREDLLF